MTKIPPNNQIDKKGKILVREDIDVCAAVSLISHGGRSYLSVRNADIEFWGLKKGDVVLMRLSKVKRGLRSGEDFEKMKED